MRCSRDPSDVAVCGDGACSIVIRFKFQEMDTKKGTQFTKHDVSRQSYSLICVHKQPGDIHIIRNDPFRATPNRLASDCSEVRAKYCVNIFNDVIGDGAVFKHIKMYHSFKIARRRNCHHSHEAACCRGSLNLLT